MKRFPNGHHELLAMQYAADWIERFVAQVDQSGDCHTWVGTKNNSGYGMFSIGGRGHLAHRLSYLIAGGQPNQQVIMHTCDNPSCVNPAHLVAGTYATNMADMDAKGRRNVTLKVGKHLKDRGNHPRSKPVMTPAGEFASASLAADHYGISRAAMTQRLNDASKADFYRLT